MKRGICFLLLICLFLSVGCQRETEAGLGFERFRIAKVTAFAEIADEPTDTAKAGYYDFCASLFAASEGENALFAPLPLYVALGIAANGAAGNTRAEMETALSSPVETVNAFNLAAYKEVAENAGNTQVSLANSLWIKDSFGRHVKESYLNEVSGYYAPEIFSLPFDDRAVTHINEWASNATGGMIEKVLEKIDRSAVTEIISALYIKGGWTTEGKDLGEKPFANGDRTAGTARYFDGVSALYFTEKAYAVRRYLDGDWFLLAVLPNEDDLGGYLANLNGRELSGLMGNEDPRGAKYILPEFGNENAFSLIPLLKKLGVNDAFSDVFADFSNMTDDSVGLYITEAEQMAKIRVNAEGIEGGATVRVEMGRKASDAVSEKAVQLDFDRPFLYFVCSPKGIPVLAGTVTKF